jgi:hypothetical protein
MIQIPLTPDQFAALTAKALQQGVALTGTEGEISKSGVKAGYKYAEGQLQVVILEKPFFVTTEYCEEQLQKFLA